VLAVPLNWSDFRSLWSAFGVHAQAPLHSPSICGDTVVRGPHEAVPVLAIGGAAGWAEQIGNAMNLAADNMHGVVIPGTGH
jgi:hypothetical protein